MSQQGRRQVDSRHVKPATCEHDRMSTRSRSQIKSATARASRPCDGPVESGCAQYQVIALLGFVAVAMTVHLLIEVARNPVGEPLFVCRAGTTGESWLRHLRVPRVLVIWLLR